MTKRREVFVSLGALALSTVLLAALWQYLAASTLYHRAGIGKAPHNNPDHISYADKP